MLHVLNPLQRAEEDGRERFAVIHSVLNVKYMYRESYDFARLLLNDVFESQLLDPDLVQESDYEGHSKAKNTQQRACKQSLVREPPGVSSQSGPVWWTYRPRASTAGRMLAQKPE